MTIRLLPPQLANQIAAGEVVERPASVIKELVENALDAGASDIVIEVEKGGSKLIRVRDNGSGVAQDELTLALSRHATSKIHDFSDLANIVSLGFRGEALASISSVSRLTLTSKPASQDNAWQAQAEGRDMAVQVRPAAHPAGTTVEVRDLFFNTPARRRFLKSDKTEFSHIDELVKRLALSRFDVSWTLIHNGQPVRQLRAAPDAAAQQKRLSALCGKAFAQQAVSIHSEYEQIQLHGWLLPAQACHSQLVCQYSYVNGRMMRDKLLGHAIRQAYAADLLPESQPAYVLYLTLPADEVDVNVHPAKHEVRFHQSRLVHDFVASALSDALAQVQPNWITARTAEPSTTSTPVATEATTGAIDDATAATGVSRAAVASQPSPAQHAAGWAVSQTAIPSGRYSGQSAVMAPYKPATGSPAAFYAGKNSRPTTGGTDTQGGGWPLPLVNEPNTHESASSDLARQQTALAPDQVASSFSAEQNIGFWQLSPTHLLTIHQQQCWLIDAAKSLASWFQQHPPSAQALLLPVRLQLSAPEVSALTANAGSLSAMGFDLLLSNVTLIIRAVPALLATLPLADILSRWWAGWAGRDADWHSLLVLLFAERAAQPALQHALQALYSEPAYWHAVPLDWSGSRQQLEELPWRTIG